MKTITDEKEIKEQLIHLIDSEVIVYTNHARFRGKLVYQDERFAVQKWTNDFAASISFQADDVLKINFTSKITLKWKPITSMAGF